MRSLSEPAYFTCENLPRRVRAPEAGRRSTRSRYRDARERISHHYHEAGHMMYLKPQCRLAQLDALAKFVTVRRTQD